MQNMKMKEQSSFNLREKRGWVQPAQDIIATNEERALQEHALTTLIIPRPGKLRIQFQLQLLLQKS